MGDLIELIQTGTDRFEIFSMESELVRAYEDPVTKKKMFKGIASSTTKDLHGDTITLSALQDMEKTAVGLTMFLNHSYDVPEDVGGTITKAVIRQKGVTETGDPDYLLEIEGEVEEDNDEAIKTWRYVAKGRKIGLSIGAMIPDGGAKRQKDGTYIIEHLRLLEVSFVGIPANPKSWVEYAASALRDLSKKATTATLGGPTITLDTEKGNYTIEGSLGDLQLNLGEQAVPLGKDGQPLTEPEVDWLFAWDRDNKVQITRSITTPLEDGMVEMSQTVLGSWDLSDPDQKLAALATVGFEDVIEKATVWVETRDGDKITIGEPEAAASADVDTIKGTEPDVSDAATCPTCGKGRGASGCDDAFHKSAEPDVTDAKIRIIEVDTDDPSSGDGQGASSSEPDESTLSASPADVAATAEPVTLEGLPEDELVRLSFGQLQAAALATLNELVETKRLLGEEKQARAAAEKRADEVLAAAGELVQRTQQVIEKVANSPLTRKATARDVQSDFDSIEAFYGEALARAITQGSQS